MSNENERCQTMSQISALRVIQKCAKRLCEARFDEEMTASIRQELTKWIEIYERQFGEIQ